MDPKSSFQRSILLTDFSPGVWVPDSFAEELSVVLVVLIFSGGCASSLSLELPKGREGFVKAPGPLGGRTHNF